MLLRQQASSGVKWSGAASIVIAALQLMQTAVLAHLLPPEDFGVMAMVMVVLGFVQVYADMGVSNAIIHRQDTTADQLSSLYWLNILAGIALFLLAVAAAPLAGRIFNEPRLPGLMVWSALLFLITPLGQQFQILLQKELRFRALATVETCAVVSATVVSISLALAGYGVYALVWGQLSGVTITALCLFGIGFRRWRPAIRFRRDDLTGYLGFGLFQMGERSINYFNSRVDQLLIGSLLGAQALGYYSLAFNLVMLPVVRLNPVIARVAFPVFSRVQGDIQRLRQGYHLALRVLSLVNFPIFFGLAVLAPWLVPLLFGDGWVPAIPLVQILAFVALLRSVANPMGSLLLAKGRADLGFYWNALLLITQAAGVFVGARLNGATGVAIALLALQLVYFAGSYVFLIRRLLGPCLAEYLMSMTPQLMISAAVALVVAAAMSFVGQPTPIMLAAIVTGAVAAYTALYFVLRRQQFLEIIRLGQGR